MTDSTPEMRELLKNDAEFYRAQAPGQVGEAMGVQEMLARADAIETLLAERDGFKAAIDWVINDANYKAPEQMSPVEERWIDVLRRALETPDD